MAVASNGHSNGTTNGHSNGHANGNGKATNGNGKAAHDEYAWGTRVIHAGSEADEQTGAVIPPLSLATTFKQSAVGVHKVSWSSYCLVALASRARGGFCVCISV